MRGRGRADWRQRWFIYDRLDIYPDDRYIDCYFYRCYIVLHSGGFDLDGSKFDDCHWLMVD